MGELEGGGFGVLGWGGTGCFQVLANISLHQHTYTCMEKLLVQLFPLLFFLCSIFTYSFDIFFSFVLFLLPCSSVLSFFSPFYLETANIHHPRPNSLSTESSSEVWAGQFYSVDKIWEYQEQLVSPSISLLRWIQKKALIPDWFSR